MNLNVLYTINSGYVDIMLVSLISLIENNLDLNITFHIINEGFDLNDFKKIDDVIKRYNNVSVEFHSFKRSDISKYKINDWHGTQIANSRLFFQSIIKNITKLDNLLYLDGDTIVVGSLKDLINPDSTIKLAKDSCLRERLVRFDLNAYYNSGVILFNPVKWDHDNCEERLIRFMESSNLDKYLYPDQDILNIALKDDIKELPYKYNIGPNSVSFPDNLLKMYYNKHIRDLDYDTVKEALDDKRILHTYGLSGIKPWTYNKSNLITPEFDKYLGMIKENYTKEELSNFLKFCDNHSTLLFFLVTMKSYLPEKMNDVIGKLHKK